MQCTARHRAPRFAEGAQGGLNLLGSRWATAATLFMIFAMVPPAASRAQTDQARITGLAHMAYYVSDLQKARDFYEGWLGFQEAFTIPNPDGSVHAVYVKINDHQYIVLYVEAGNNHGFMHDAGFETNNAEGMREHLASIGVKVPDKVTKNAAGNLGFDFLDNSGFTIQIVQYLPGSMTGRTKGKFMPPARISDHIDHLGLLVDNRPDTWKFYSDAFGFTKDGDGSKMAVPGSPDRFELGVERKTPIAEARYHIKDHLCLSNADVPKMTAGLRAKSQAGEFPDAIADTHQLGNGKNVVEIYDLNKNRIEVMEPLKAGEQESMQ
jgi:catechol 2,3-dioxygenase-like lactoylglutathione lyase family enzyme/predicted enzyme related to lactoylglutathione lyase